MPGYASAAADPPDDPPAVRVASNGLRIGPKALVSPPPVHSDIAARVSTRREMVARELKALERAGLLSKRRGAFVLNNVPELMHKLEED